MEDVISLRHELHRYPELSGYERETAIRIADFLRQYKPDEIHTDIAGAGIAAVYKGEEAGATLLFRCDMDALPIQEISDKSYRSSKPNISHLCGHDGHMAMVSGLAARLHKNPIAKGKVILFYQPEEENGRGAKNSIEDLKRLGLMPDYAFAIHNIPKQPFGSVILGRYNFSAASKGMIVRLTGKNAHAAYPESGINPSAAVAEIIQLLNNIKGSSLFNDFVLATIVHVRVGEVAFGTSAGYAEVMATLRAFDNNDMQKLSDYAVATINSIANKYKLRCNTEFVDEFPATACDPNLTHMIEGIAEQQKRKVVFIDNPNRWSEDFAHFTLLVPSVIFGLGVGENHPDLHTNSYDFPDEAIPIGVDMMERVARFLL